MAAFEVHVPVLVQEIDALLALRPGDRAIDATIDGGGHATVLLERIGADGAVLGIDRDPDVIEIARAHLRTDGGRLVLVQGSFRDLASIAQANGFGPVRAVLFDLGMSSFHLDRSGRGFSFQRDEPLDMRFDALDPDALPAAEILDTWSAGDLTALFREYGEERFAGRIARRVVEKRPIMTTTRLLDIITDVLPGRERHHAARSAARIFQALRIAVNDEIEAIAEALPQAVELLAPGGRLAVISFHSLEDRLVKRFLAEGRRGGALQVITKRPLRPSDTEVAANPRAASAKLRVAERLG